MGVHRRHPEGSLPRANTQLHSTVNKPFFNLTKTHCCADQKRHKFFFTAYYQGASEAAQQGSPTESPENWSLPSEAKKGGGAISFHSLLLCVVTPFLAFAFLNRNSITFRTALFCSLISVIILESAAKQFFSSSLFLRLHTLFFTSTGSACV